ncbi:MAG TPA: GTPase Era [Burkholderiales bacterium]|nr:GTPase Era [Burkholderiales bacterium]
MSGPSHRAGYVAIVGRPNVGKSTLLNQLVGQKISITSRKPQTTRRSIIGILTRPDIQLVFVDTPGFQARRDTALSRLMNRSVIAGAQDVHAILFVIEALKLDGREIRLRESLPPRVPLVAVINKIDRVQDKTSLLPFMRRIDERLHPAAIVPVSALRNSGLEELLAAIAALLPEGPRLFHEDEITRSSERFLAAELIREKLFRTLGDELPYAAAVDIAMFETEGGLRRIHAEIIVDKASQKPIVIGKKGEKLKAIATRARQDMEQLFGGKVFLEVWVKVKTGWADDERALHRLGYDDG